MKVKEYLNALGVKDCSCINLTFLECIVEGTGIRSKVSYKTTPIHTVWEWKEHNTNQDMIVLNTKVMQPAWIGGADWNPAIEHNLVMSLLVISEEDFIKRYGKEQALGQINYIDKVIMKGIEDGTNPWIQK